VPDFYYGFIPWSTGGLRDEGSKVSAAPQAAQRNRQRGSTRVRPPLLI
jgi:hypothetical protein